MFIVIDSISSSGADGKSSYSTFAKTCAIKYPVQTFIEGIQLRTYSQLGQSEWIFGFLTNCGITKGTVIELGAHSPNKYSNSRIFIEHGWDALLVEGDAKFCSEWELYINNTSVPGRKIILHEGYIDLKRHGIDDVITQYSIETADVLFLDIDGGEWHLLESLSAIQPSIVCVEADNGYPHSISYTPKEIEPANQASHRSMNDMMKQKGYHYLFGFAQDLIYVHADFAESIVKPRLPHIQMGDDLFYSAGKNNLEPCISVLVTWMNFVNSQAPGPKIYDYASDRIDKLLNNDQTINAVQVFDIWDRAFNSFMYLLDNHPENVRQRLYSEIEDFYCKYRHLSSSLIV